jgi:hypothetical protein
VKAIIAGLKAATFSPYPKAAYTWLDIYRYNRDITRALANLDREKAREREAYQRDAGK